MYSSVIYTRRVLKYLSVIMNILCSHSGRFVSVPRITEIQTCSRNETDYFSLVNEKVFNEFKSMAKHIPTRY